jgi:hypothetical protein
MVLLVLAAGCAQFEARENDFDPIGSTEFEEKSID